MLIRLGELRTLLREAMDPEVISLLRAWSDHVAVPFSQQQLIDFAQRAMLHPDVFAYGPQVPKVFVYRGYRAMDNAAVVQLLGKVPSESGVYSFRPSKHDMSWSPDLDVAFTVAEPDPSGKWYAVGKTDTTTGQWIAPGPKFEQFVVSGGVGVKGDARVMSSEYLQITPGRRSGRLAIIWADPVRDFDDVARELDELSRRL